MPKGVVEKHEIQLGNTDKFWGEFLKIGATIRRHDRGKESALEIVKHVLNKTPLVLQFQKELANVGIIGRTTAGEQLILDLAKERTDYQRRIEKLEGELQTTNRDKVTLEKDIETLNKNVEDISAQIKNLETKLDERMKQDKGLQELQKGGGQKNRPWWPQCPLQ